MKAQTSFTLAPVNLRNGNATTPFGRFSGRTSNELTLRWIYPWNCGGKPQRPNEFLVCIWLENVIRKLYRREESKAPYDSWIWKGQFNLTSNYVFQDRRAINDCETEEGRFSYDALRYWKFYFIYFTYTCEIFISDFIKINANDLFKIFYPKGSESKSVPFFFLLIRYYYDTREMWNWKSINRKFCISKSAQFEYNLNLKYQNWHFWKRQNSTWCRTMISGSFD